MLLVFHDQHYGLTEEKAELKLKLLIWGHWIVGEHKFYEQAKLCPTREQKSGVLKIKRNACICCSQKFFIGIAGRKIIMIEYNCLLRLPLRRVSYVASCICSEYLWLGTVLKFMVLSVRTCTRPISLMAY